MTDRPYYTQALNALNSAHEACLRASQKSGEACGMSHGSFSGVNEVLGIVNLLEQRLDAALKQIEEDR